ncbi:MAG TPA: AAA family ATPase, partial [Bacteroidales bacterium]|nr:AAA family ATPase [Bacteroidales bacterium]
NYNTFVQKLTHYIEVVAPKFVAYEELKRSLLHRKETEMRLNEFKPQILSSFVRNKLINEVYLPLVGNNLAKQIGTSGENKRTDRMGMLLLISPPGYGKTTLMEYIAGRLGLIFMKINGPSLGHEITSVDPAKAGNAASREELKKLNLAFEMGDNVMIYIDDIQHCNPEFLQKFITVADGQRKIEGVYNGISKTYDFRGKKVCVVMAGNPYTETGEKFQIPDMLANRADTYNLGDIIGDTEQAFVMSYIENSLTSNPTLASLASKSQKDLYSFIQMAQTGEQSAETFEASYSAQEVNEYVAVLKKLITIRDTIFAVNKQYIASAAQAEAYRTEPHFKLQGSYRDMNKISEKVVSVMNDQEIKRLLLSHYENESQTLTADTEANMLKFKELTNTMDAKETERWESIITVFRKNKEGNSQLQMNKLIERVTDISAGIQSVSEALNKK